MIICKASGSSCVVDIQGARDEKKKFIRNENETMKIKTSDDDRN